MGSEYWEGLLTWIRKTLRDRKLISRDDMDIIQVMDDPQAVLKAVQKVVII